ncbi:Hypothetical_protein [Hexamita inflata]|uniref:Hypothetical_protein n=1 Tax=Hexamita inflata TaxID=28002 RepID=A0AA86QEL0_9EUKA|nr:Hypothetical protein HINF_LOCUS45499 [Hexamita inflata]
MLLNRDQLQLYKQNLQSHLTTKIQQTQYMQDLILEKTVISPFIQKNLHPVENDHLTSLFTEYLLDNVLSKIFLSEINKVLMSAKFCEHFRISFEDSIQFRFALKNWISANMDYKLEQYVSLKLQVGEWDGLVVQIGSQLSELIWDGVIVAIELWW